MEDEFLKTLNEIRLKAKNSNDKIAEEFMNKQIYLVEKFMPLKNTIDKNWGTEIEDIKIKPPKNKIGYWIVTKHISTGLSGVIFEDDGSFEIYKKTDKELELEMLHPKEDIPDLLSWNCKKCNEENEGSFDSCWKCQTLNE